jgi:hypothetical protein
MFLVMYGIHVTWRTMSWEVAVAACQVGDRIVWID